MNYLKIIGTEKNESDINDIIQDLYEYINKYALEENLEQTLKALPYARKAHKGQFRKGKGDIPYIYHPLIISVQAISLGLGEDEILASALLHDVCEDCGIKKEELPVREDVRECVYLLTKDISLYSRELDAERIYYERIMHNRCACIVKLLDRCNNISDMVNAFSKEKMIDYMESTRYYILPLFDTIDKEYPDYADRMIAVKYHMLSIMKNIVGLLEIV